MIFYNLPSLKSNALNYVSVEIITAKLEEPVKKEIIKPNRPEIKPLKKEIIPSLPIDKPKTLAIDKPKTLDIDKPVPLPIDKPVIKQTNNDVSDPSKIVPDLPPTKPIFKKDVFDDMLKNLAEDEPDSNSETIKELNKVNAENVTSKNSKASISPHLIAIKIARQINQNWTRPPGLKNSDDMAVPVRIRLRIDGTIINILVLNRSSDSTYIVYQEAAERALNRLKKFEGLPPDKYSSWKIVELNFIPINP